MAEEAIYAICILRQDGNSGVSGVVKVIQQGDSTIIQAKINGLATGLHGFHIH